MASMKNEMTSSAKPAGEKIESVSFMHSPSEAIQIIEDSPQQPLLLELDLTLVLGSTTEAFLDSVRPSSYAKALLAVTDKVAPWRLLSGRQENRDWIRVLVLLLLMPWSYLRWRAIAASWAEENANGSLVSAAQNHKGPVVVITRGFDIIVNPVVNALHLAGEKQVLTIACKAFRWKGLRQFSKTEHVERSTKLSTVEDSIVVSDSMHDRDLFVACQTPVLTEWEGAYWIEPHENAYVPLRYVQLTKTPFKGFVQAGWVKDDLYIAVLALSSTAWFFPLHAVGIALLSLALWITYETGYYENDMVGSVREVDPVLPKNFAEVRGTVPKYAPWVWAFAITVVGSPFVALGSGQSIASSAWVCFGWMAVLVEIRLVFALFNRLPKVHRVIPHLFLQIGKYLGYLVVTSVSTVGAILLVAQIVYRWVPYVPYRWSKSGKFAEDPLHLTRFLFFAVFAIPSLFFFEYSLSQAILCGLAIVLLSRRAIKKIAIERSESRSLSHARSAT